MSSAASTLFTSRCPVCQQGPLFSGWLTLNDKCSHCGARFLRDPGSWTGATVVAYMCGSVFAMFLIFWFWVTGRLVDGAEYVIAGIVIVFQLVILRFVKAFWVGVLYDMEQVYADPLPRDDPAPSPDPSPPT